MPDAVVIEMVMKQGVWAGLFIWLFISTMKKNDLREKNYQKVITQNQKVIESQSKAFTSLAGDVHEIKTILKVEVPKEEITNG